jgi:hypothetical protein
MTTDNAARDLCERIVSTFEALPPRDERDGVGRTHNRSLARSRLVANGLAIPTAWLAS